LNVPLWSYESPVGVFKLSLALRTNTQTGNKPNYTVSSRFELGFTPGLGESISSIITGETTTYNSAGQVTFTARSPAIILNLGGALLGAADLVNDISIGEDSSF
jgi:hypothetical protein